MPTRYSLSLISVGTPIRMWKLPRLNVARGRVRAARGAILYEPSLPSSFSRWEKGGSSASVLRAAVGRIGGRRRRDVDPEFRRGDLLRGGQSVDHAIAAPGIESRRADV